ncbi:methionine adenosyltransferase [Chlamydiales bacterium]|nr:methionine adenosyltransferase [Chlamydiales bacterium]
MKNNYKLFAEAVAKGHPDKIADQISDAILDAYLEKDPMSFVACETLVTKGHIKIGGEISSKAVVDIPSVIRSHYDIPHSKIEVLTHPQSQEISHLVNAKTLGAGDQAIVTGYAIRETEYLMPLPITLAKNFITLIEQKRDEGVLPFILNDGKVLVIVEYLPNHQPIRIETLLISFQHNHDVHIEEVRYQIKNILPMDWMDEKTKILINPKGPFTVGGLDADTGLTGRKIVIDNYGPHIPLGGGSFSGKDPTKIDRSGSYMARHIAKTVVANHLANEALVSMAYAIGFPEPIGFHIETKGPYPLNPEEIQKEFPLDVQGIIDYFNLRRPIYFETSHKGHFGVEHAPWEKTSTPLP